MILYVRGRQRLAMNAAVLASFLFSAFLFGVFSARNTTQGILLLGATFCLIIYWVNPPMMVWVALFAAAAALPQGLHIGKVIGPVSIYAYHVALILAICYLIPIVRPRFSSYLLPGMFFFVVVYFTAVGLATGHPADRVAHETTYLFEMVAGYVLALLIVRCGFIRQTTRAVAVTLWFSAGMTILSSLHGIRLAGRNESLEEATGAAEATRVITTTLTPAITVLTALVAAAIVARVRLATVLLLAPPTLVISLLAFSRNTLISIGVAAALAFAASMGWSALRRTAVFTACAAAVFAVTIPGVLFVLQHSAAGTWLGDQFSAFNHRVFGGVSSSALAADSSTLARLAEDDNLNRAIAQAPLFGHGLGYAYQLPFGNEPDEFTATLGTTYSHNFYLWWLCKTGAAGMAAFAVFALTPIVRALRSASAPAKISAAVCAGLLAMCVIDPLPEDPANALNLGMALGAAMAFAARRRDETDPAGMGAAVTVEARRVPALAAVAG